MKRFSRGFSRITAATPEATLAAVRSLSEHAVNKPARRKLYTVPVREYRAPSAPKEVKVYEP